ncbi:hypothetical protein ANCCAN_05295 [Ancylostoma caninum]|uniref:Uncharacterized protein n=1 Tax=Ancylostoma caninum TaxID=29170 RepID=A0A368GWB2_ANCCA|nr:hypothetical protein ANCCAN_05295 [Ancylostoma caninum]
MVTCTNQGLFKHNYESSFPRGESQLRELITPCFMQTIETARRESSTESVRHTSRLYRGTQMVYLAILD